jgi:hypothetical protein
VLDDRRARKLPAGSLPCIRPAMSAIEVVL